MSSVMRNARLPLPGPHRHPVEVLLVRVGEVVPPVRALIQDLVLLPQGIELRACLAINNFGTNL